MFGFPPLPPYEGLHPIVVHFPIALLLFAWVPILMGLLDAKRRQGWLFSGALLLIVGTAFAFFAVMTGGATEHAVDRSTDAIVHAIHEHEEVAETARNIFVAVTVIYLLTLILHAKVGASKKKTVALAGAFLFAVSYILASLSLANAGHLGGLLVHEMGIKAPMGAIAAPLLNDRDRDDDHDDDDD